MTGKKERIREFDLARAFAVIAMIAVHTEYAVYDYGTTWFGTLFDYLGSPFAAPVFMFILGANVCLSSKNSPKQLFVRGASLFGISIIFNVICHALPFFILDFANHQTEYASNALHWVFAADILTFSSLAFMFFAAVKKFRINNFVLAATGIAASVANAILTSNFPVDFDGNTALAAVTGLFYNSSITGYFSFLSWIIFPIAGYIFIQILVNVKDKTRFYLISGGVCLPVYLICIFISHTWLTDLPLVVFSDEYSYYRMHPFNAFATVAFCIAWISIMYFIVKILPKALERHISRLNRNLTKIFIIQWFLINYCLVLATNNTLSVNEWQFILCFIAVFIASDFVAWLSGRKKRIIIRKALRSDIDAIANIYDEIHTAEENGEATIGWIRGVYPVKATAEAALARGDLFVIEKDGTVLGSGIINKIQVDVYAQAKWEHEADAAHVCVLHTLTISPHAGGMGLGKQFVAFYESYALKNGCPELRIDTNERNQRARNMYRKLGYKEIDIVPTVFNGIPGVNLILLEKYSATEIKKICLMRLSLIIILLC